MSCPQHAPCAPRRRAATVIASLLLASAAHTFESRALAQDENNPAEGGGAAEFNELRGSLRVLGRLKSAAADFNNDGAMDVVVITPNTVIDGPGPANPPVLNLYFGWRNDADNGVATVLPAWEQYSRLERLSRDVRDEDDTLTACRAVELAAGDFNGDGWIDLVVVESDPMRAVFFMNVPKPTSPAKRMLQRQPGAVALGDGPWSIAVRNITAHDACDDVVIACASARVIRVLLGSAGPAQGFACVEMPDIVTPPELTGPMAACIGLFDTKTVGKNHSAPDVACLLAGGTRIALYRGVGDGTFNTTAELKDTGGKVLLALWPGDYDDSDKDLDVLSPTTTDDRPVRIKGMGDGKFQLPP